MKSISSDFLVRFCSRFLSLNGQLHLRRLLFCCSRFTTVTSCNVFRWTGNITKISLHNKRYFNKVARDCTFQHLFSGQVWSLVLRCPTKVSFTVNNCKPITDNWNSCIILLYRPCIYPPPPFSKNKTRTIWSKKYVCGINCRI